MMRLFWIAIPLLLASASLRAEWTWPWENSESHETGGSNAGFLGDLFGGKRTHLELDVDMDIGMRYDMEYRRSGYSRYLGYQYDHATGSQHSHYSQPYGMPRQQGRSTQAGMSHQGIAIPAESYRSAFAAQRRVVEQLRTTRKVTVPHFESTRTTASSEADPESMFRQLEAERDAAFREMEERRLRHVEQTPGLPATSHGLTLQQE